MPSMTSQSVDNTCLPPPPPPPPPPPSLLLPPLSASPNDCTKTPTRRLQWVKIPEVKVKNSNNVWNLFNKLKPKLDVNTHKVEQLFSYKMSANQEKLSNRFQDSSPVIGQQCDDVTDSFNRHSREVRERSSFNDKRKRVEEINLLDFNRSRNVYIFLRSLNMHNDQVVSRLSSFDWQAFDTDTLKTLVRLMPTEQDSELLNSFSGDITRLGAAERFYLSLLQLPSYQLLAELLLVTQELKQLIDVLLPGMESIKQCVTSIKDSEAFRTVLHAILTYGNLLNNGARTGGAVGFSLNTLPTLTDLKTNDHRTLMHIIAEETVSLDAHLIEDLLVLKSRTSSSLTNMTSLVQDLKKMKHHFDADVIKLLEKHNNYNNKNNDNNNKININGKFNNNDSNGSNRINNHNLNIERILSVEKDLNNSTALTESKWREMEELREDTATFFCEDETTFNLEDFISTVHSFATKFLKAHAENEEKKDKMEMKGEKRNWKETAARRGALMNEGRRLSVTSYMHNNNNNDINEDKKTKNNEINNINIHNNLLDPNYSNLTLTRARSASCKTRPASNNTEINDDNNNNENDLIEFLSKPQSRFYSSLRRKSKNNSTCNNYLDNTNNNTNTDNINNNIINNNNLNNPSGVGYLNSLNLTSRERDLVSNLDNYSNENNTNNNNISNNINNNNNNCSFNRNEQIRSTCPSRLPSRIRTSKNNNHNNASTCSNNNNHNINNNNNNYVTINNNIKDREHSSDDNDAFQSCEKSSVETFQESDNYNHDLVNKNPNNNKQNINRSDTYNNNNNINKVAMGAASLKMRMKELEDSLNEFDVTSPNNNDNKNNKNKNNIINKTNNFNYNDNNNIFRKQSSNHNTSSNHNINSGNHNINSSNNNTISNNNTSYNNNETDDDHSLQSSSLTNATTTEDCSISNSSSIEEDFIPPTCLSATTDETSCVNDDDDSGVHMATDNNNDTDCLEHNKENNRVHSDSSKKEISDKISFSKTSSVENSNENCNEMKMETRKLSSRVSTRDSQQQPATKQKFPLRSGPFQRSSSLRLKQVNGERETLNSSVRAVQSSRRQPSRKSASSAVRSSLPAKPVFNSTLKPPTPTHNNNNNIIINNNNSRVLCKPASRIAVNSINTNINNNTQKDTNARTIQNLNRSSSSTVRKSFRSSSRSSSHKDATSPPLPFNTTLPVKISNDQYLKKRTKDSTPPLQNANTAPSQASPSKPVKLFTKPPTRSALHLRMGSFRSPSDCKRSDDSESRASEEREVKRVIRPSRPRLAPSSLDSKLTSATLSKLNSNSSSNGKQSTHNSNHSYKNNTNIEKISNKNHCKPNSDDSGRASLDVSSSSPTSLLSTNLSSKFNKKNDDRGNKSHLITSQRASSFNRSSLARRTMPHKITTENVARLRT